MVLRLKSVRSKVIYWSLALNTMNRCLVVNSVSLSVLEFVLKRQSARQTVDFFHFQKSHLPVSELTLVFTKWENKEGDTKKTKSCNFNAGCSSNKKR